MSPTYKAGQVEKHLDKMTFHEIDTALETEHGKLCSQTKWPANTPVFIALMPCPLDWLEKKHTSL